MNKGSDQDHCKLHPPTIRNPSPKLFMILSLARELSRDELAWLRVYGLHREQIERTIATTRKTQR